MTTYEKMKAKAQKAGVTDQTPIQADSVISPGKLAYGVASKAAKFPALNSLIVGNATEEIAQNEMKNKQQPWAKWGGKK